MHDFQTDPYSSCATVVVRHKVSGTFWSTSYAVRVDDSDRDEPTNWHEVAPEIVTVTRYKTKEKT